MLAKRIIPCLDVKEGLVVKGEKFVNLRPAGDPVELAEFYNQEGADELVFLDITASAEKRNIMLEVVRRTAEKVFIPFTVGGGINDPATVRQLLLAGADKVSLNTAAVRRPQLLAECAGLFGSQCTVLAIDARRAGPGEKLKGGRADAVLAWEVYVEGGRTPLGIDAIWWAQEGERLGAGEILLTSMDADGTKAGYDLALTAAVSQAVKIPVIASGGAGTVGQILDVFTKTSATAALLASILHYKELTIPQIKCFLKQNEVPVREV